MMKKILLSILLASMALPAWANHHTKPTDQVGILYEVFQEAIQKVNKRYYKPWGKIKLDKASLNKLHAFLKTIDLPSHEKYRLGFIHLVNDSLSGATYYGDHGGTVSVRFGASSENKDQYCYAVIDGNGPIMGFCSAP